MEEKVKFKQTAIKIGSRKLNPYGYEYFDYPPGYGIGVYYFRKHLGEDIYAFVEIQKLSYVHFVFNGQEFPRRFRISLLKNIGNIPRYGYNKEEENLENWLYEPLSYLLWTRLDIKVYESPYHEWKYHDEEEMVPELEDAFEMTIKYGIPWMENPNSKRV